MNKLKFYFIFMIVFLNSFFVVGSFFLSAFSFEYLIKRNLNMFLLFVILDISFILIGYLLSLLSNYLISRYLESKGIKLTLKVLQNKIIKKNLINFNEENNSKYLSWIYHDIEKIKEGQIMAPILVFKWTSRLFFIIVAVFYFSWIIGILMIFLSFISWFISYLISKKYENIEIEFSEFNENNFVEFEQIFNGLDTLYFFDKTHIFKNNLFKNIDYVKNKKISYKSKLFKLDVIFYITSLLPQFLIVALISVLAYYGQAIYGSILSIGFMVGMFFSNSSLVSETILNIVKGKKLSKKHFNEDNLFIEENKNIQNFEKIELKNINLINSENQIFIKNLSLIFHKGKKYLLKGKSGIGKSYLLKAMLNYDLKYDGVILYDGINVKEIDQIALGNVIEYIDSNNFVFYDTIKNNITLWEEKPDLKKLENIFDFLDINHLNLDQKIDQQTNKISEGEKQLISLAKAIYFDKQFWFIDEGFNNIDASKIKIIEKYIFEKDITLIYVSHDIKDKNKLSFDAIIDLEDFKYD